MCDVSTQTFLLSEDLDAAGVKRVFMYERNSEEVASTPLRASAKSALETPETVRSDEYKVRNDGDEETLRPSILVKNRKRKRNSSSRLQDGLASLGSVTSGANVLNLSGKPNAPQKRLRFDITPVKIQSMMPIKKVLQLESRQEAWRELKKRGWSLIGRKKYTSPTAVIGRDEYGVKYIKDGVEGVDYFYSQYDALAYLRKKYLPEKVVDPNPAETSGDFAGRRHRNSSTRAYGLLTRSLRQQGLSVLRL